MPQKKFLERMKVTAFIKKYREYTMKRFLRWRMATFLRGNHQIDPLQIHQNIDRLEKFLLDQTEKVKEDAEHENDPSETPLHQRNPHDDLRAENLNLGDSHGFPGESSPFESNHGNGPQQQE